MSADESTVGGLAGHKTGSATVSNCYYDSQTTGQSDDNNKGTPKTTAEMKQQATFSGWDFTDTWKVTEGVSYPYLGCFAANCTLTVSVIGAGTVTPAVGSHTYAFGETVTLSAVPVQGYVFSGWVGANVADPTATNTTIVMDSSKNVTAHFRKIYNISTLAELQAVKNNLDGHYILMNDIDASATSTWNAGAGFEPIGTEAQPFTGIFNGNGKKITGLTINRPDYVGLFGYTGSSSKIIELGVEGNVSRTGTGNIAYDIGILVGHSESAITKCYASGSVTGKNYIGGMVGRQDYGGAITECYASCNLTGSGEYVGGLVGRNGMNGTITSCYASGSVS